jgi:hypothetical protein
LALATAAWLRGPNLAGFFALLMLAMCSGIGVFILLQSWPLPWPEPRVEVAGLQVRSDLSGSVDIPQRRRPPIRFLAAPLLPPGATPDREVALWVVRESTDPPADEATWRSDVPLALLAAGGLAAAGIDAVQDAARRHGLAVANSPRLLRWTRDVEASLARQRTSLLLLLAGLWLLWLVWLLGEMLLRVLLQGWRRLR